MRQLMLLQGFQGSNFHDNLTFVKRTWFRLSIRFFILDSSTIPWKASTTMARIDTHSVMCLHSFSFHTQTSPTTWYFTFNSFFLCVSPFCLSEFLTHMDVFISALQSPYLCSGSTCNTTCTTLWSSPSIMPLPTSPQLSHCLKPLLPISWIMDLQHSSIHCFVCVCVRARASVCLWMMRNTEIQV